MKFHERIKREIEWLKKEYGIITPFVMGLFRLVQYFPFQIFIRNRTDHYYEDLEKAEPADKKVIANRRASKIEVFMIFFLLFEIITPLVLDQYCIYSNWIIVVITVILGLRLIDIIQVNVNMVLFDGLRFSQNIVAKYSRAIILLIWNYLEIILIFGFIYFLFHTNLQGYKTIIDAYYFSTITQLTIGFGDIKPEHCFKIISAIQGIIGTLFLVLIIAKFIDLIPRIGDIDQNNKN